MVRVFLATCTVGVPRRASGMVGSVVATATVAVRISRKRL
jgi:hypothetical protein